MLPDAMAAEGFSVVNETDGSLYMIYDTTGKSTLLCLMETPAGDAALISSQISREPGGMRMRDISATLAMKLYTCKSTKKTS